MALVSVGRSSRAFSFAASTAIGEPSTTITAGRRKAVPKCAQFAQRLTQQPKCRPRRLHAQPQIGIGNQDAGAPQDALASALRSRRRHRLQDFARLPEITAVVEHDPITQRRVARRDMDRETQAPPAA
jgi:hypothetical protein